MKINIFKIDSEAYPDFLRKIQSLNMNMLFNVEKEEWVSGFYISKDGEPTEILWKKDYIHLIPNIVDIKNYNYYALNIFKKNDNIFVISYGKAHFYIKPFCDTEFGLNIVKRIGDVDELKMKQSKRFAGKKKKEIRSYKIDSSLEMESGESVDYLGLGILKDFQIYFGKSGKFGNSAMLSIENLKVDDIHKVLEEIVNVLRMEEKFTLPKLEIIKDKDEIMRLNNILIRNNDILNTENTDFELIGVNFIFEPLRKYKIKYKKNESSELTDISVENINNFIRDHNIPQSDILKLEIIIINDDGQSYKNNLYSMIEYYIDEEFTMLENGKWKKFNQDYIKWINDSVDKIEIEKTEEEFKEIIITEPDFNKTGINIALSLYNYTSADTVLERLPLPGKHKIEECDLHKDGTLYAVKFGTAQKMSYCVLQAIAVLEVIRNMHISRKPKSYCLWFAFDNVNNIIKISDVNSIILKQQIDEFKRKCKDLDIIPKIKISKKIT